MTAIKENNSCFIGTWPSNSEVIKGLMPLFASKEDKAFPYKVNKIVMNANQHGEDGRLGVEKEILLRLHIILKNVVNDNRTFSSFEKILSLKILNNGYFKVCDHINKLDPASKINNITLIACKITEVLQLRINLLRSLKPQESINAWEPLMEDLLRGNFPQETQIIALNLFINPPVWKQKSISLLIRPIIKIIIFYRALNNEANAQKFLANIIKIASKLSYGTKEFKEQIVAEIFKALSLQQTDC